MNRLLTQLPVLEASLLSSPTGTTIGPQTITDVTAFLRGIDRKIRFAQLHMQVISGIEWGLVESVGRQSGKNLRIVLPDAELVICHSDAVVDHVYIAFDGLIAAVINITDTLSRLLNSRYGLGIDQRRASLFSLKNHCSASSPLAAVIADPLHSDWLTKVKDLRGRCQHADVENVMLLTEGPYSRRGQPVISPDYDWQTPAQKLPVSVYSQSAIQAAEATALAVIQAVLVAPNNPFI